jgi:hypothetical protein
MLFPCECASVACWRIPRFLQQIAPTEQTSPVYLPTRLFTSFYARENVRVKCMQIFSCQVPQLFFIASLPFSQVFHWVGVVKRQATHRPLSRKYASHFVSDKGLQHPKTPPAIQYSRPRLSIFLLTMTHSILSSERSCLGHGDHGFSHIAAGHTVLISALPCELVLIFANIADIMSEGMI